MNHDLLDRLAEEAAPVRPVDARAFMTIYGLGLGATLLVIAATGFRSDLPIYAPTPVFLWKLVASALVALPGAWLLYRCGRPGAHTEGGTRVLIAVALAVFVMPLAVALLMDPAGSMNDVGRLEWVRECVPIIISASVPLWVASLIWLRRSAPTNLERASWAAGLTSAASAASLFALHCPFDRIAYAGFWYFSTIIAVAVVTRLIMPLLIRW